MGNANTNDHLITILWHRAANAPAKYGIALGDYECRYQKLEHDRLSGAIAYLDLPGVQGSSLGR